MMTQWTLSQPSFEHFLKGLDPNRDRAGEKYEDLRHRIVKFFEWRACRFPEDLADEALNRLIMKTASGTVVMDHAKYAYTIAKFVYLEEMRRSKEIVMEDTMLEGQLDDRGEEDLRLSCLEKCLEKLPEMSRSLILQYYADERQAKIDHRKKIAERLNLSANALRIKTLRIRTGLENCVLKCLEKCSA